VALEVLPDVDLAAVASGSDPLALVARKLLVLDGPPSEERERLLQLGRERLEAVAAGRHYRGLEMPELADDVVSNRLRAAALRLSVPAPLRAPARTAPRPGAAARGAAAGARTCAPWCRSCAAGRPPPRLRDPSTSPPARGLRPGGSRGRAATSVRPGRGHGIH